MSGSHSLDSVFVDVVVGLDSSCLRSTHGVDGLDEVVTGVSVSSLGSLSEFPGVSSLGGSVSQVVESLNVGSLGVSVSVVSFNHFLVSVTGVMNGLDVVVSHVTLVLCSFVCNMSGMV